MNGRIATISAFSFCFASLCLAANQTQQPRPLLDGQRLAQMLDSSAQLVIASENSRTAAAAAAAGTAPPATNTRAQAVNDVKDRVKAQVNLCAENSGIGNSAREIYESNAEAYRRMGSCFALVQSAIRSELTQTLADPSPNRALISFAETAIQSAKAAEDAAVENSAAQTGASEFMGYTWGVGFGISYSFRERITDAAEDDGGIVRAKTIQRTDPRVILEFHNYDLFRKKTKEKARDAQAVRTGNSPYIAVVASNDNILEGLGLGWMWGRATGTSNEGTGMSVGVGAILDKGVAALPRSIKKDEPLPDGESVRYVTKSRWSAMLFVTRTF